MDKYKAVGCLLSAALLFSTSGCVYFITDKSVPVAADVPIVTAVPSPSPTATPFSVNPVYSFYSIYNSASKTRLTSFSEALTNSGTSALLDYSLALEEHRILLSDAQISIGMLSEDTAGSGYYTVSLGGTVSGSGTLIASDGGYNMEFIYTDGNVLSGFLSDNNITYTIKLSDNTLIQRTTIIYTGDEKWLAYVERSDIMSVLCIEDTNIFFARFVPQSEEYAALFALPTVSPEPDTTISAQETSSPLSPSPILSSTPASTLANKPDVPSFFDIIGSNTEYVSFDGKEVVLHSDLAAE